MTLLFPLEGLSNENGQYARAIDLDVDIGADAVDYNAIAKAGALARLHSTYYEGT